MPRMPKDKPKKVKRPPNPYCLFLKSRWDKMHGKKYSFTALSRKCSTIWARMTDEEKKKYKDQAAALRDAWFKEKCEFLAKRPKKRAPGPFIIFCADMRERVKRENPDFHVTEVARELGRMWKKLSDREKAKYFRRSREAQSELYQKRMEEQSSSPNNRENVK